jgi:hypothetical protein
MTPTPTDSVSASELRKLLEKATKGPWYHYDEVFRRQFSNRRVTEIQRDRDGLTIINWTGFDGLPTATRRAKNHNARLIVAAVNALPALLDRVEGPEKACRSARDKLSYASQDAVAPAVAQANRNLAWHALDQALEEQQ